jgi:hypothetical protein
MANKGTFSEQIGNNQEQIGRKREEIGTKRNNWATLAEAKPFWQLKNAVSRRGQGQLEKTDRPACAQRKVRLAQQCR